MAELANNNKKAESTGISPFYAYHKKHTNLFDRTFPSTRAKAAMLTTEQLKETHEKMRKQLGQSQQRQISYVNKKRKMAPRLEKGDKVYPPTKNLRTRQPSKGLDHVKVRPFLVKEQSRPVNYVLDLLKDARIHPKFHIKMLKPADPDTPLQTTFYYESEEEIEFEVKKFVDSKQTTTT